MGLVIGGFVLLFLICVGIRIYCCCKDDYHDPCKDWIVGKCCPHKNVQLPNDTQTNANSLVQPAKQM